MVGWSVERFKIFTKYICQTRKNLIRCYFDHSIWQRHTIISCQHMHKMCNTKWAIILRRKIFYRNTQYKIINCICWETNQNQEVHIPKNPVSTQLILKITLGKEIYNSARASVMYVHVSSVCPHIIRVKLWVGPITDPTSTSCTTNITSWWSIHGIDQSEMEKKLV